MLTTCAENPQAGALRVPFMKRTTRWVFTRSSKRVRRFGSRLMDELSRTDPPPCQGHPRTTLAPAAGRRHMGRMNPLTRLLGIDLPVLQAPMAGVQGSAL